MARVFKGFKQHLLIESLLSGYVETSTSTTATKYKPEAGSLRAPRARAGWAPH